MGPWLAGSGPDSPGGPGGPGGPPSGPGGPGGPPDRPGPPLGAWLEERLFDQRVVLVNGTVTSEMAARIATALLTLDALGPQPVQLRINSADGDLDAVLTLVDALDAMTAPVHAVAVGEVGGAAIGAYAAADRRLAYPHARFRLAEPAVAGVTGTADQIALVVGRHLSALEDLVLRVVQASGQPRSRIEDDLCAGRLLSAAEAVQYGLVDEILSGGKR
ncbi:MAG TPA: ATP-dependent Clp protease proteolytic subunit [Micromonosporaceae bacterium]